MAQPTLRTPRLTLVPRSKARIAEDEFVGWWLLQPPHGPDQPEVAGEAELGYRLLRRQ